MTAVLSPLRMDCITGSRLPAIMGLSPYTTPRGVMREMVRQHNGDPEEFVDNPVTQWGRDHERDNLRAYAENQQVQLYGFQEFVRHPKYDFLGVTLDARAGDGVVEAKAPWRADYSHINDREDYQEQCGLQIECTGADYCHFSVWRPDRRIAISTLLPEPGWLDKRMPVIEDFMSEYWAILADPELAEPHRTPLVDQRTDPEWQVAAFEYLEEAAIVSKAELALSASRLRLVELAGKKSARGYGVTVTRSERRGNVDWQAGMKKYAPNVDPEEFRKGKPKIVFTVRAWTPNQKEES